MEKFTSVSSLFYFPPDCPVLEAYSNGKVESSNNSFQETVSVLALKILCPQAGMVGYLA